MGPRGEVAVVLSGSMLVAGAGPEAVIGESSYLRAVYALRGWRTGAFHKMLISGGGAPAIESFLRAYGVPKEAILLEVQSASTYENALFSKPLLEGLPGKKLLLTSDYHMYRAIACFRKLGIAVEPYPFPDLIKRSSSLPARWQGFWTLTEEMIKMAYYRWKGWV